MKNSIIHEFGQTLRKAAFAFRRKRLYRLLLGQFQRHFVLIGVAMLLWGLATYILQIAPQLALLALVGGLLLWILILGYLNCKKLGGALENLQHWDEIRGLEDLLSNAWQFSQNPSAIDIPSVQLHLRRANQQLGQELKQWNKWYPIPWKELWRLTVVLLLGLSVLFVVPTLKEELNQHITQTSLDPSAAKKVAQELREIGEQDWSMKSVSPRENAELREEKENLQKIVEGLESGELMGLELAMESIESVAAGLEKMSRKMEITDQEWMSTSLLQSFKDQKATSAFAQAVQEKDLNRTHNEATLLRRILANKEDHEVSGGGFIGVLRQAKQKADETDKGRLVSTFVLRSSDLLNQNLWKESLAVWDELLDRLKQWIERESNKQKLAKLTEQIRDQGGKLGLNPNDTEGGDTLPGKSAPSEPDEGDQLPTLSSEMLAPPLDMPLENQGEGVEMEVQTAEGAPPAISGSPSEPQKDEEANKKKKAQFFAPVPGMAEEEAKKLSKGFQIEGKLQNDPNAGTTTADLGEDGKLGEMTSKMQRLNGQPSSQGEASLSTLVPKTQISPEAPKISGEHVHTLTGKEREQAIQLEQIPARQRNLVRDYFIQLRRFQNQDQAR